jgi:membrane-bound serine protease (ClpP class)
MPSYGALGIGGVAAFALRRAVAGRQRCAGFGVPLSLIGALTLVSAAFVIGIAGMAAKARRRPVVSGRRRMIGTSGEVIECTAGEGWAEVDGERWKVRAAQPLRTGERVRVTRSRRPDAGSEPRRAASMQGASR